MLTRRIYSNAVYYRVNLFQSISSFNTRSSYLTSQLPSSSFLPLPSSPFTSQQLNFSTSPSQQINWEAQINELFQEQNRLGDPYFPEFMQKELRTRTIQSLNDAADAVAFSTGPVQDQSEQAQIEFLMDTIIKHAVSLCQTENQKVNTHIIYGLDTYIQLIMSLINLLLTLYLVLG